MQRHKLINSTHETHLRSETREQVIEMIKDAEKQPKPDVRTMFEDVYAVMPPHLEEEYKHLVSIMGQNTDD